MSYGLPYYQLASKWMATDAPIVAALLRVGDAPVTLREIDRMIGLGARLFAYAVDATWSDERPPDGVFVGPFDEVAALLEAAVQWDGVRGSLVKALIIADVIERLEMGLRVRGCDRYRQTWEKNRRRKDRTGAKPAGSGPVPSGSGAKPGGTVRETETETETDEKQQQHLAGASGGPPPRPVQVELVPGPTVAQLQAAWNELTTPPLPRWAKTPKDRARAAANALKRRPLEEWREVFRRIEASAFCRGATDRGSWVADVDWALKPAGVKPEPAAKVLEGKYDNPGGPRRDVPACEVCGDPCKFQEHGHDLCEECRYRRFGEGGTEWKPGDTEESAAAVVAAWILAERERRQKP